MTLSAHLSKENFYLLALKTLTSVCIFSILFSIHFQQADKENLFNNQKLLLLVIISSTLMTFMFDSGVIY